MRSQCIRPEIGAPRLAASFMKRRAWVLFFAFATACTQNTPNRTVEAVRCEEDDCDPKTYLEQHQDYDLAFVEFTERGNVFSRERMNQVLDFVGERAQYDPEQPDRGVLTVVFVHGWKHNASAEDENVASFRKLLPKVAKLTPTRRVIGVYVGWRGLSIDWGDWLTNISYWDRKAAAEQAAKGGVTELLLRLEREVIDDEDPGPPNRNLYFVTGHSFGGAVVLAALSEILLERVVSGIPTEDDAECVQTESFGHGVVLLNPAIEANEALQLKELVAETCFGPRQIRLMHVISSDADMATNQFFRVGQQLGVNPTWKQTDLYREFDGKRLRFRETDLDTVTVGNFKAFQTGQLDLSDSDPSGWRYRSCVGEQLDCLDEADRKEHIPVQHNEPLAFIHTDVNFIADHNDVFNDNVAAYLAAIMAEARYKLTLGRPVEDPRLPGQCRSEDFGPCFAAYQARFKELREQEEEGSR
jgi:pimeloyl-ACP methyl ester carboxylesterase